MSVTTDLEAVPFSATLRASTKVVHEQANHSEYMNALFGGELTLAGYTQLAIQYYFIYQALEQVSDRMTEDGVGREFVFDELRRVPNLEADLAFLAGPDWRETIRPLAATEAYVRRIHEASEWAGGYVAHHYTRYLGDLAGGQIIRRLVAKNYGVTEDGSLFYHFEGIGSAPAFRDRYREKLNSAPWDEAARARLIDETLTAFACNIAVFAELAADMDRYRAA